MICPTASTIDATTSSATNTSLHTASNPTKIPNKSYYFSYIPTSNLSSKIDTLQSTYCASYQLISLTQKMCIVYSNDEADDIFQYIVFVPSFLSTEIRSILCLIRSHYVRYILFTHDSEYYSSLLNQLSNELKVTVYYQIKMAINVTRKCYHFLSVT